MILQRVLKISKPGAGGGVASGNGHLFSGEYKKPHEFFTVIVLLSLEYCFCCFDLLASPDTFPRKLLNLFMKPIFPLQLAGRKVPPPHVTEEGHHRKTVLGTLKNNFLKGQILFQKIL